MQTMQKINKCLGALVQDPPCHLPLVVDEGTAAVIDFERVTTCGELPGRAGIHANQEVLRRWRYFRSRCAQLPGVGRVVDPDGHAEVAHGLALAPESLVGFLNFGVECGQIVLGRLGVLFGLLQARLGHQRLQRRCGAVGGADGHHDAIRGRLRR